MLKIVSNLVSKVTNIGDRRSFSIWIPLNTFIPIPTKIA